MCHFKSELEDQDELQEYAVKIVEDFVLRNTVNFIDFVFLE